MLRWLLAMLAAIVVWNAPAAASGDYGCAPSLKLMQLTLTGCDNRAALTPGNDTRVNLMLLWGDARSTPRPAKPDPDAIPLFDWPTFRQAVSPQPAEAESSAYAWGEGSRCRSNTDGAAAFAAAVAAAPSVTAADRTRLIAARQALQPDCSGAKAATFALPATGPGSAAAAFARYLGGAAAFYAGDYDAAAAAFAGLRATGVPWLDDTARYMRARVEVNRAQVGAFDQYGTFNGSDAVDAKVLANAEALLLAYVRDVPKGRFIDSARGLLRRVYWLGGDTAKLSVAYAVAARTNADGDLADEIDDKFLRRAKAGDVRDPALLATIDIARMRDSPGRITRDEIEGQRSIFPDPDLHTTLLALHDFYVAGRPQAVLRAIPATRDKSYTALEFSRQLLRGMALEAIASSDARAFWTAMLPAARALPQRQLIELALAMHDERAGAVDRVFDASSAVHTPLLRETLLTTIAGPPLLRKQARNPDVPRHERQVALYALLYKEVTRGRFADFVADTTLAPANDRVGGNNDPVAPDGPTAGIFVRDAPVGGYGCPSIKRIAALLAADARAVKPRLCLAEFVRLNNFDLYVLDQQPPKDELGGTRTLFPGRAFSRLDVYRAIIAEPGVTAPDRAYALFRAVRCYAPSGSNSCGGVEAPVAQRKAWFLRLKRDFPNSRWAGELDYYW